MSEVESVSPSRLLNCQDKPFGLAVVEALWQEGDATELCPEARDHIKDLKMSVRALVGAKDKRSQDAAQSINDVFEANDSASAAAILRTKYRPKADVLGWIQKSSYRDIAQLAMFNVQRYAELQEALTLQMPYFNEETLTLTDRLINLNVFPQEARQRMERLIDTGDSFHAMDSFEAGAMGARAYCTSTHIGIGNLFASDDMTGVSSDMMGTVFHEREHEIGEKQNVGFFHGINKGAKHRWLEESTVTHASLVAINTKAPQPTVLFPADRRYEGATSYSDIRTVWSDISEPDAANIPVDLWYEGFFSDKYSVPRGDIESRLSRFFQSISDTDDEHALYEFSAAYETAYCRNEEQPVVDALAKRVSRARGIDLEIIPDDVFDGMSHPGIVISFLD